MLPFFKLFNEIIYTYPLLMGVAWGIGYQVLKTLDKNSKIKHSTLLFWGVFVFSWIGAKVFFLVTSSFINKELLLKNTNFWLGGGFVFYGGLVGGVVFILLHKLLTKEKWNTYSLLVPSLALGHGIGRIGCFFAGCCYGKEIHRVHGLERYPVQLMEASFLIILYLITYKRIKMNREVVGFYIISYAVVRFFLEFLRGDLIRGVYYGVTTSQIISLLLIFMVLLFKRLKLFNFSN